MSFQLPNREDLLSESVRYETYQTIMGRAWTADFESARELAQDGFYYTGELGRVACIFCNLVHHMSYIRDLHWIEHRLTRPMCPFIRGDDVGNIPISQFSNESDIIDRVRNNEAGTEETTPEEEVGQDVHDDYPYHYQLIQEQGQVQQNSQTSHEADIIDTVRNNGAGTEEITPEEAGEVVPDDYQYHYRLMQEQRQAEQNAQITPTQNRRWHSTHRPSRRQRRISPARLVNLPVHTGRRKFVHPQNTAMRSESARFASFKNWPISEIISPKELAEAGFYYTGVYDHARCFHCNGTLSGWELNDNVWGNHAYYFPRCHFLYLKRGQVFVDNVKSPNQQTTPLTELPVPSSDLSRYTCKICMCNEIGTVFAPCDHAIACVDCSIQLSKCPLCNNDISNVCRLKMIN